MPRTELELVTSGQDVLSMYHAKLALRMPATFEDAGSEGVALLAGIWQTREFVTNQYRHGKTILAVGASKSLLDQAEVATTLPSGEPDPGILMGSITALEDNATAFITAVGKHRHPARETDPLHI